MNDEQHREKVEQFLDHTHTKGGDVKYPELPKCYSLTTGGDYFNQTSIELFTADQMRSYADAACALRGAQKESHAAPGAPQQDCPNCFEGKSDMDHDCRVCSGTGRAAATAPAGGVTDSVWEAIYAYTAACDALQKRRAKGELMNADFIDAVDAAAANVDKAIAALQAVANSKEN